MNKVVTYTIKPIGFVTNDFKDLENSSRLEMMEGKAYYYSKFNSFLKKGGYVILEVFSKKHIDYVGRDERVGGPRDLDTLVSIEEIKTYFPDYQIIVLEEKEITLKEGLYHIGKGSVIRFVGRKK